MENDEKDEKNQPAEEKKQEGEEKNKNQGFVPRHKRWESNEQKPRRFMNQKSARQPFRHRGK